MSGSRRSLAVKTETETPFPQASIAIEVEVPASSVACKLVLTMRPAPKDGLADVFIYRRGFRILGATTSYPDLDIPEALTENPLEGIVRTPFSCRGWLTAPKPRFWNRDPGVAFLKTELTFRVSGVEMVCDSTSKARRTQVWRPVLSCAFNSTDLCSACVCM